MKRVSLSGKSTLYSSDLAFLFTIMEVLSILSVRFIPKQLCAKNGLVINVNTDAIILGTISLYFIVLEINFLNPHIALDS
jgi:hypothetical protein